jgi:hypothetical protein
VEERRLDADPRVEDVICAAVSVPPAAAAVSVFGDAAVVVQVTGSPSALPPSLLETNHGVVTSLSLHLVRTGC